MTTAPAPEASPSPSPVNADSLAEPTVRVPGGSRGSDPALLFTHSAAVVSRLLWAAAILSVARTGFALLTSSPSAGQVLDLVVSSAISFILYIGLARAVLFASQVTSSFLLEQRSSKGIEQPGIAELSRIAAALERVAVELKDVPRVVSNVEPDRDLRHQSIARFEQALASGDLALSLTLLETHIAEFAEDDVSHLQSQLAVARSREIHKQTALLDSARQVNDPDRVLEVFNALKLILEDAPRETLERELARWFLSLVHRRLRSGTIQPDVVNLAQKVSDNFGSTVEGASLRAALPTMRRSVGLCPRCAQPYVGSADACPRCLNPASTVGSRPGPAEADGPDLDDAGFDDSDDDDLPLNHLAIDDSDLGNLRLIDPELDVEDQPDRLS